MTRPPAEITEALRRALTTALSVQLHEAADPSCSGEPPYSETQAQAESIAELVVHSPVVENALLAAAPAPASPDEPSTADRTANRYRSIAAVALGSLGGIASDATVASLRDARRVAARACDEGWSDIAEADREREARAASAQRLPGEAAPSVPPLDEERLARALREIFASLEYQRWHEPEVLTWQVAAEKVAAAYAAETPEQDRP